MVCVDANVWIYFLDANLDEHEAVRGPVDALLADRPLFTTTVIQMEVVHYLSNQLTEPGPAIERFLNVEETTVASLVPADATRATGLLQRHDQTGVGGRDATIVAAMERCEISELWTHDAGLKRVGERLDWLSVVDPVEEAP